MTSPDDHRDDSTSDADSPPGGGRSPYAFLVGLVGVVAVIGLVALLIGVFGGDQSVPSR